MNEQVEHDDGAFCAVCGTWQRLDTIAMHLAVEHGYGLRDIGEAPVLIGDEENQP